MAYPSTLSTFTDPLPTDKLNAPSHSGIETAQNTGIEEIQVFVGTIASAAGTLVSDIRSSSSNGGGHIQTANKGGTGITSYSKGDLLVGASTSVLSKLAVSTDGLFLVADSTQQTGVKWGGTTTNLTLRAGENLAQGNSLVVGAGLISSMVSQTSSNSNLTTYGIQWTGQTFTTSSVAQVIPKITLNLSKTGAPAGNLTVNLYTAPSSIPVSVIGTVSVVAGSLGAQADSDFNFVPNVSVVANTKYAVVMKVPSGDSSNRINFFYDTNNSYAGGNDIFTTDGGSNWTQDTGDGRFKIHEIQTIPGMAYKASASVQGELSDNFIGFAGGTTNAGSVVSVNSTIDTNQSSLVSGYTYYLSNTSGAIGSVAGTVSRKIGIAISSVTVLVKLDNP